MGASLARPGAGGAAARLFVTLFVAAGGCAPCGNDLTSDVAHCGACGHACALTNAVPACISGGCAIASCKGGFGDCDRQAANGCERDLRSDPNHCGDCKVVCPSGPGAIAACSGGACSFACSAGFANCDHDPTNGCEANIETDSAHCGSCQTACSLHKTCQSGACSTAVCEAGFGDCNRDPTDGCETDLRTSAAHCGSCGSPCAGLCKDGACGCKPTIETIAAGQYQPSDVAVSAAGDLYWAIGGGYLLHKGMVKKRAGGVTTVLADKQSGTGAVVLDAAGNVYWTAVEDGAVLEYTGGMVEPLAMIPGIDNISLAVAASGKVYWTGWANGTIYEYAGGKTTVLATDLPHSAGVAVDAAGDVYWVNYDAGAVRRVSGGQKTTLASEQNRPTRGAMDAAGNYYWINHDGGTVMKYSAGATTQLASGQNLPASIAVDPVGAVYWTNEGDGSVIRYSGGAFLTVATSQVKPYAITADGTGHVYWTTTGTYPPDGTVMKATLCQ